LWGRTYSAARNAPGLQSAQKLITFCFNDRASVMDQNDFNLLLSTIEGDADVVSSDEGMAELAAAGAVAISGAEELWNQRQGEIIDSELGEVEGGWHI
jgi:hypothetical protein